MSDAPDYTHRDYRGTRGAVDDAEGVPPADSGPPDEGKKLPRGRVGVSRGVSPRQAVRDPGPAREGEEGEPAYGAPTSPAPVQEGEREKRKQAKKDALKPQE